jgi:hypothetical protein
MSHESVEQSVRLSALAAFTIRTLNRLLPVVAALAVAVLLATNAISHTAAWCDARGVTTMSVWGVTIFPEGRVLSGDATRWWGIAIVSVIGVLGANVGAVAGFGVAAIAGRVFHRHAPIAA